MQALWDEKGGRDSILSIPCNPSSLFGVKSFPIAIESLASHAICNSATRLGVSLSRKRCLCSYGMHDHGTMGSVPLPGRFLRTTQTQKCVNLSVRWQTRELFESGLPFTPLQPLLPLKNSSLCRHSYQRTPFLALSPHLRKSKTQKHHYTEPYPHLYFHPPAQKYVVKTKLPLQP